MDFVLSWTFLFWALVLTLIIMLLIYLFTTPKYHQAVYRVRNHALTTPHLGSSTISVLAHVNYKGKPRPEKTLTGTKLEESINALINSNNSSAKTWQYLAEDLVNAIYPNNDAVGVSVEILADDDTNPLIRTTATFTRGYVESVTKFDDVTT